MKKILAISILILLTSFSANTKDNQQTEMVYVCSHPSIKCYFLKKVLHKINKNIFLQIKISNYVLDTRISILFK